MQYQLKMVHQFLMYEKFPYHSVSVIHRYQDLGFHVMFMDSVKEQVTERIKKRLEIFGFGYSFVSEKNEHTT